MSDHYNRCSREISIGTGKAKLYDAAANRGEGGETDVNDLIQIAKNVEESPDKKIVTITLDILTIPATFDYFPAHPVTLIVGLDVAVKETAKKILDRVAKQLHWLHPDSAVTVVSYGEDEQGLGAVYQQLKETESTYQKAVLLITDGQSPQSEAADENQKAADKIKDPQDGNTLVFAVGIGLRTEKKKIMEAMTTTPAFFRNFHPEEAEGKLERKVKELLQDILRISVGSRVVLYDIFNPKTTEYIKDSLSISGFQDGVPLASKNQAGGVPQVPVLTEYSAAKIRDGVIVLDLGILPDGNLSSHSQSVITVRYQMRIKNPIYDSETYIQYQEPMHFLSDTDLISYPQPPKRLDFPKDSKCNPDNKTCLEVFYMEKGTEKELLPSCSFHNLTIGLQTCSEEYFQRIPGYHLVSPSCIQLVENRADNKLILYYERLVLNKN